MESEGEAMKKMSIKIDEIGEAVTNRYADNLECTFPLLVFFKLVIKMACAYFGRVNFCSK
jgi:hypothetical protein